MNDHKGRRYNHQGKNPQQWAIEAAQNAAAALPYLVEPGEDIPVIRLDDMAARIEAAFEDRTKWNEAIHESALASTTKIWLIVPE